MEKGRRKRKLLNLPLYLKGGILLLFFPLLGGCWDAIDLEERATILALSVDEASRDDTDLEERASYISPAEIPTEKNRLLKVTVQISIPGRIPLGPPGGEGGGGGGGGISQKPVWVLHIVAHSLADAMNSLQQQLSQRIFLGHLRVIVVSEKFARKGLEDIRDFLMRTPQIRKNAWLVIAKGTASLFLESTPELERVPALYILDTLDKAVEIGKLPPIYNGFFFSTVVSKGKEGVLPYLEIKKKKGNVIIDGLALFRKERMVGKTKPLEIGLYMEVESINPGGYDALIPVEQGEVVSIVVLYRQSKVEVRRQGGKPKLRVKIYLEADVSEKLNDHFIIKNSSTLEKIEKAAEKEIGKMHKQLIKKTQRLKSDIFGFGEYVRAKLPDYWRKTVKTKERWEEIYPEVPIEVSVNLTLRRTGMQAR